MDFCVNVTCACRQLFTQVIKQINSWIARSQEMPRWPLPEFCLAERNHSCASASYNRVACLTVDTNLQETGQKMQLFPIINRQVFPNVWLNMNNIWEYIVRCETGVRQKLFGGEELTTSFRVSEEQQTDFLLLLRSLPIDFSGRRHQCE